MFFDRSVVEVFVDHQANATTRVYPTKERAHSVSLVAGGASATPCDAETEGWQVLDTMAHARYDQACGNGMSRSQKRMTTSR